MNGEEMLQVIIFHPYCMELQGYSTNNYMKRLWFVVSLVMLNITLMAV